MENIKKWETAENIRDDFGKRIKQCRKKLNITQNDLANKMGISVNSIQNYEAGSLPKGTHIVSLAKSLQCSIDWLLTGESNTGRNNVVTHDENTQNISGGTNNNVGINVVQGNNSVVQGGGGAEKEVAHIIEADLITAKGMRLLMKIVASENTGLINAAILHLQSLAEATQDKDTT